MLDSSHDNKAPARYCPLPVSRRGFGRRLRRHPPPQRSTLSGVRKPSLSPSPERYATGLAIIQACSHIFYRLPLTDAPRENSKSLGGGSPAPVPPRPTGSASAARASSGFSPCGMSLRPPVALSFLAAFSGCWGFPRGSRWVNWSRVACFLGRGLPAGLRPPLLCGGWLVAFTPCVETSVVMINTHFVRYLVITMILVTTGLLHRSLGCRRGLMFLWRVPCGGVSRLGARAPAGRSGVGAGGCRPRSLQRRSLASATRPRPPPPLRGCRPAPADAGGHSRPCLVANIGLSLPRYACPRPALARAKPYASRGV